MATGYAVGLWEVKDCASSRAKFICRQNQDTSLSPEPPAPQPTPSLTGSCPNGWKSNSNLRHCYKVDFNIQGCLRAVRILPQSILVLLLPLNKMNF